MPAHSADLDVEQVIQVFCRWLEIRAKHEDRPYPEGFTNVMRQMHADVWHSALLRRLLDGKEPLPEPPPLSHSYPVYPKETP